MGQASVSVMEMAAETALTVSLLYINTDFAQEFSADSSAILRRRFHVRMKYQLTVVSLFQS